MHPRFVVPGIGVIWRMREDLSGPYPGFGLGALDAFHGYVVYRLLAPELLAPEIAEMRTLVEDSFRDLVIAQDLGLGMMLWLTHFFPTDEWAAVQRERCAGGPRRHVGGSAGLFLSPAGSAFGQIFNYVRCLSRPAGS